MSQEKEQDISPRAFLSFIFWFFIMFSVGYLSAQHVNEQNPAVCYIPDRDAVNLFCKQEGFQNGWLSSSSCGWNEVLCHTTLGKDIEKYTCVEWVKP